MNKFLQKSIFIVLLFVGYIASAQTPGTATGKVLNAKDKSAIDYASVAIKNLSDSSNAGGSNTSVTGGFTIQNLKPGKYRLYVAFLGFKTLQREFTLTAAQPGINFGDLLLEDTGVDLKTVEVKGDIPPVIVKKDTIEFNASVVKVKENAVVEDGLKKLPGVDVSKDGTITAQGEAVRKVRVDGKDFMGGTDPLLATKNLPWDMVDKIQIIDDMSDQSKFSGVDDGNREKVLNIVTKNGIKNKGFVGNNTVGYGTNDRYDVNLNVNYFNENEQASLIGQFNNVNKQNFGGGVGGGGGGGRGNFGGGNTAQTAGITKTSAGGFNYANTYKSGTQFTASYFINSTSLYSTNNSLTQNFLGKNTSTNQRDVVSTTDKLNHRLNFLLDTKIDSVTSIRIQPNLTYTDNSANSLENYSRTSLIGNSMGSQSLNSSSTAPTINNSILIRRKFLRRGRTLSLNISTGYNSSDGGSYNINPEMLVSPTGATTLSRIDNFIDNNTDALSNTARLVYTEPLSKTMSLEMNYTNGYSKDNKHRLVYNFNNTTQQYDVVDLDYTNEFENTTLTNAVGLSLNKTEKKYNWNVGLGAQRTNRENDNLSTKNVFNQNFTNITPTAQFRYNFSNSKRLNIRYDGRTNQPSIDQIQPIRDNSNTQSVPFGNPNLKPSFSNNLRIFYNNFDFTTYRTLFLGAFITQTFNDFGNSQYLITDPADVDNYGKIANGYVNVDGSYSGSLFGNLSLPIIKGNKLNFQINASTTISQNTNFTENLENVTKNFNLTNGYKLVSNLDKLDLIAGISGTRYQSKYTIGTNTKYYQISPNIDISYMFPGDIRLQTDVTYNKVTGRGAAFDTDFTMVNAYMSRQFFKNRGTFKVSVNDLFNENTGVTRSSSNNSISDSNFNVLKRYFMFSFTYSLANIAGVSNQGQGGGQGGQRTRMGGF